MLTPDQILQLEQYHSGKLSKDEKSEVEKNIINHPELAKEAQGVFEMLDGFNALHLEQFNQNMMNWEQKHQNQQAKSNQNNLKPDTKMFSMKTFISKYRYAAAAVILILFMPVGYLAFRQLQLPSPERLYAANIEHYNAFSMGLRSGNNAQDSLAMLYEEGISSYNSQNYTQAAKLLNEYYGKIEEDKKTSDVKLYLGLSNLFSGNTEQSKVYFESIIQSGKADNFKDAAEWYLALAYLKEMNGKKSAELLQSISSYDNHPFKDKANTLLPEVQRLKQ